jgi:excinuclease UvrABC nuclease subunit
MKLRELNFKDNCLKTGTVTFRKADNLAQALKPVPKEYGVYIISDARSKEVLYIGMAGKFEYKKGGFKPQRLRKRLSGKQDGQYRRELFPDKMKKLKMKAIIITWGSVDTNKLLPAKVEADLMQQYYEYSLSHSGGKAAIPPWNKEF